MFRCPSCGLSEFTKYLKVNKYRILRCRGCDLLSTEVKREVVEENNIEVYSENYALEYKKHLSRIKKRYLRYLSIIEKYNTKGKLLDIGCGTGYFIRYLLSRNKKNLKVHGVEPNSKLRKIAQTNTGIDIKEGKLSNIPYSKSYFDILLCLDVLEHSIDLKKNILEIRRVLKSNGIILIQAPNYDSFMTLLTGNKWDWWSPPDHTVHFSLKSLCNFLIAKDFKILDSYTYEDSRDFLINIKGSLSNSVIIKIFFYLASPILIILERAAWLINKGGLMVVVAQKK